MIKQGQAIMEFLMTYGWAILAAIIAIAVLAHFGVLNPETYEREEFKIYEKFCILDDQCYIQQTENIELIYTEYEEIPTEVLLITGEIEPDIALSIAGGICPPEKIFCSFIINKNQLTEGWLDRVCSIKTVYKTTGSHTKNYYPAWMCGNYIIVDGRVINKQ
ncbi:MAG: hypothetical protein AABY22_09885 [Nanoarchaeota archaeon]